MGKIIPFMGIISIYIIFGERIPIYFRMNLIPYVRYISLPYVEILV